MGETKNEPRKANGRSFEAHIVEPRSSTNLNRANLRTTRANENATPMHNPRTTRAYSVSFPVCIARSQLSNISTSGHTKHVTRIAMAIIRHVRERIGMKYTVQTRELDPKIARGETKRLSSITAVRSMLSPALEQFEKLGRSKTPELVRLSSAVWGHKVRPHPIGALS